MLKVFVVPEDYGMKAARKPFTATEDPDVERVRR